MQAFKISPLSPGNYLCSLRLAEKIYDEGPEADLIKAAIEEELLAKKPDLVRQKLLVIHSTPEAWMEVPWPDRYNIRIGEIAPKGLMELGSTLGVANTLSGNLAYLEFVATLFPEDAELKNRLEKENRVDAIQKTLGKDPKAWAVYLRSVHAATLEEWNSDEKATNRERRKKFAGKGLKWIATNIFGLESKEPVIERDIYYMLGKRIFS